MRRKIFFLILIILIILGGVYLWQEIYLPKNPDSTETKIFQVTKGEGAKEIALNLEKGSLVKWGPAFRVYIVTAGVAARLQAGTYELSPAMNIPQIVRKFVAGDTLKVKITIPEGRTMNQIQADLILYFQHSGLSSFKIKDFKGEFGFLKDSPETASLEGFLFPDTYFFKPEDGDREIIKKFLENFEDKVAPYRNDLYSAKKKIFEIITMASLLEKEVKTSEDKKLVSGILWKRLENKMPLQVDATVAYLTGKQNGVISVADTKIDSPYNTYRYRGLPPGPIANPGLESILAALAPAQSDSWYYLSTKEGQTIFSKTLAEHNLAVTKYLK